MRRLTRAIVIGLVLAMMVAVPVLASDISDATYIGTITVTNVGTATTNVSVPFTLSTANLITAGFVNAAVNNTCIQVNGADVAYMPAPAATTDWSFFTPSVTAGNSSALLYTGGGDMAAKWRYFPGATGMTVPDAAGLELGNSFDIDIQDTRVDTSAGSSKDLVSKLAAFQLYVSGATNITSGIGVAGSELIPDGFSDPGGEWATEINAYDNNVGTSSSSGNESSSSWSDYLILTYSEPVDANTLKYYLNTASPSFVIDIDAYYTAAWNDVYQGGAGTLAWETKAIGSYQEISQIRFRWQNVDGVGVPLNLYEFRTTGIAYSTSVTATGIAAGEHDVHTWADTVKLYISIDGAVAPAAGYAEVALAGASVPDNANNWTFFEAAATPYAHTLAIDVGGVPVSMWQYENAATFADSIGANDATPSFRTTSSDADVSAVLADYQPIVLSEASVTLTGSNTFIGSLPAQPSNMYTEGETGGMIFDDAINPALASADVPEAVFWYPIAFAIAICLGFGAYALTKQLFVQAVISGVVMAAFSIGGVLGDGLVPYWAVLIFGIEAFMIIVIQERQSA